MSCYENCRTSLFKLHLKRQLFLCTIGIDPMGNGNPRTDESGPNGQSRRISDSSLGRHIMLSPPYRVWTFHILDICPYQHIPKAKNLTFYVKMKNFVI